VNMKYLLLVLLGLGMFSNASLAQHASATTPTDSNDVGVFSSLVPGRLECLPVGTPITIAFGFGNNGLKDQTNQTVYTLILGNTGLVIYRDSQTISTWPAGSTRNLTFKDFQTKNTGETKIIAYTALSNDANRANDTMVLKVRMANGTDARSVVVLNPAADTTIDQHSAFRPIGCLWNAGATDLFDVPVRVEIRSCTNLSLVYRADTTVEALLLDSLPIAFQLPTAQGTYDVSKLAPGCYRQAVITRVGDDGDRTDDTAYANFTIVSHAAPHNVKVAAIVSPLSLPAHTAGIPVIRIQNTGSFPETSVAVSAVVRDPQGIVIYRDSTIVASITPGASVNVQLSSFSPNTLGLFSITATADLSADGDLGDNSVTQSFSVGQFEDLAVLSISDPDVNEMKSELVQFTPKVMCQWTRGGKPSAPIFMRMQIVSLATPQLVFQTDTMIAASAVDNNAFSVTLPSAKGSMNTGTLVSGAYSITVFRTQADSNRLNDTAHSTFSVRAVHDLQALSPIAPTSNERIAIHQYQPVSFQFKNAGLSDEPGVKAGVVILDSVGSVVYRDEQTFASFDYGKVQNLAFKSWIPSTLGSYREIGYVSDAADKNRTNDSLALSLVVAYPVDLQVVRIVSPSLNEQVNEGSPVIVTAMFSSHSVSSVTNVPVHLQIRSCSSSVVQMTIDTSVALLEPDGLPHLCEFPSVQGGVDTRSLPQGCYSVDVIVHRTDDGDHSNDTATTMFSVVPLSSVNDPITHPHVFTLSPNFPNPFDRQTTLRYELPNDGVMRIGVRDLSGRQVVPDVVEYEAAGSHTQVLVIDNVADGAYVVTLSVTDAARHSHSASRIVTVTHNAR
jgi:hypothetical protein